MKIKSNDDLILLISEKSGEQARDNGFAYFEYRMKKGFRNTFYIYKENNIDMNHLEKYKENILLKDSKRHRSYFKKADYLLLNDGYMDVFPSFSKRPLSQGWSPIVYLQHGIISYKKVHFHKGHYNGRIRYFHTSLNSEKNIVANKLQSKKDIKETHDIIKKYQFPYLKNYVSRKDLENFYILLLTRYYKTPQDIESSDLQKIKRLINNIGFLNTRVINSGLSRHHNLPKIKKENKNLLFFFTWREEWTKEVKENEFLALIKELSESKSILDFANKNELEIVFYLHEKVFFLKENIEKLFYGEINFVGQSDFKSVLENTYLCVTDYSSVAFEFNLLKTPVIYLQFDYDKYKNERGHFLKSPYDFLGITVEDIPELNFLFEEENINKKLKINADNNFSAVKKDYKNYLKTNRIIDSKLSKKQKHIVYFCYNVYGIGGTVQTVINQANYLVSIGFMVTIISLRRTDDVPKLYLDPSVRLEYLNDVRRKGKYRTKWENFLAQFPSKLFKKTEDLYLGLSLLTDIRMYKIIKTFENSVLVGTFPGLCVNLIKFSNNSNTVLVQEHKEFSSHSKEIQKSLLKHYKKSKKVIVLTNFQNSEYREQGITNVTNIPNGIQDKYPLLQNVNIGKPKKRIVSFGRIVKIKQFYLLVKSFSLIANKYPDWTLDIYGDGDEKNNVLELIEELNVSSQVIIHPPTSLVYEELYNSSFCALTAYKEPFGMVYIESFSMGKPVVSYDIGYGPKEFLIDGYNSLVSPCFDVEHFARNLEKLIQDENLLLCLGKNARETYLSNYEISKIMNKFLQECA